MGKSVKAHICYGIAFDGGFEFPWKTEEDNDIIEWWLSVQNFKPPLTLKEAFATNHEKKFFDFLNDFIEKHPCPFVDVTCCSGGYSISIVAVPSSYKTACIIGEFHPEKLVVTDAERQSLIDFCEQHILTEENVDEFPDLNPKWHLCGCWG